MKISTKIFGTLLGMSLLVALVGALAVNRQKAAAVVSATKEAQDVAELLGFLLLSDANKLSASSLQEIILRLSHTQERDVVLLDAHQSIIASAFPREIGTIFTRDPGDAVGATIKDRQVRTFVGVNRKYPAGIRQIVVPVEGAAGEVAGAVVLEFAPLYDELTKLTAGTVREVVLATFGSIAVALLIALYMGRSIAAPLRQLATAATGFASGKTGLPLPSSRPDEIGELATAFHDMMLKRQQAKANLRRLTEDLENRVEARTRELAHANEILRRENTERKQAESALRESNEKFHQLADHITDVFWIRSPDLREVHYVSPAFEKIWGRSVASLHANPHQWTDFVFPEDRERVHGVFAALTDDAPSVDVEYRIVRPDGEIRWVRVRGFQVRDAADQLIRHTGIVTDITERKLSEQVSERALQRLNAAQRIGQIGDWEWDVATQAITWSPQVFKIVGRDPQLGPPRNYAENAALYDPVSRCWLEAKIAAALESGEAQEHELVALRPDGERVHIHAMAVPRKDESGKVVGLYGTVQDISARKRSEAALWESEARHHSLFENMLEGAMVGRLLYEQGRACDYIYESVNGAFATQTGLKDVVGKKVSEVVPGMHEANPEQLVIYSRVEATGHPERFETFAGKLGIWFSVSVYSHEKGRFVAVFDNITDRKRAEDELSRSREMLARVLDQIPQRVFWKDRDFVYRGCNRAFAVDMGFRDPGEVMGKTDFDATWKGVADLYRADDRAVMEANAPKTSFEEPGIGADGAAGWLRTSKTPLHDADGNVAGVLGTYEDVTEHKRAKLEIEQLNTELEERVARRTVALAAATTEAERANRAKSEFLSRMSHELRTPMNAILGFAQVLGTEEGLTGDQRESVDQILKGGSHLLGLINEVLDISSIDAGRLSLSSEPIALAGLLDETISLLRPLSAELRIRIAVGVSENVGAHVLADRQRLKQVLLNLLGNALKYNRAGGSVTVRYAAAAGDSPARTRLSVTDTGPGLSADQLARLFSPFERLGAEQTRIEGTGLGLVLARRMVEHMGGTIGVESVVGEGSTFWIELPTAEAPAGIEMPPDPDATPEPVAEVSAEARVILYIEDNPSNVRLVTRILARRPAVVLLCAETGARGLEMAREHRPDLILLDLHLPDSHGSEVLARLAADPRTGAIPVVMLTADVVAGKRSEMLAAGACAFLTKPLDVRNFLALTDQFLALKPAVAV